jgi:CHASE2 domain-containing sensor protein
MDWWSSFTDWFLGLGREYGVNPVIFGSLYVGSIPFFTLSLGWVIKNLRQGKPIAIPLLLTGIFFISAYLYLVIVGENIPVWVYLVIIGMTVFGIVTVVKKVRRSGL